ncbi:uncharacterized protein QC764_703640 [Podospora pseudoanserina]|uniref:Myb-like domain-containing protein n=1 Tax=Podospora pseudoanserina TaxID=2609844 RepID=A0ABR0HIK5_9PEZI|nr:hypothetical protein QC764_703640 [Podospora pseudoanserina]
MLFKRGSSQMDEGHWGTSIPNSRAAEKSKAAVKIDRRRREGLRGKKVSQRQARQLDGWELNSRGECGLPAKGGLDLFINLMRPQVDMLWPVQDLLPSAAWAAEFKSDIAKTPQLLLPHDMSFNTTSLLNTNGVDESGSQHLPPSGLGIYDQRAFPMRSGSIGNSTTFLAADEQTGLNRSSPYVSVSHYSHPQSQPTDPRTNWHQSTTANLLSEQGLSNPSYWQQSGEPAAVTSFVSSQGGDHWDQETGFGANAVMMEYNQSHHYTLGHNTLPQTDHGLGHGLPLQDLPFSAPSAMSEDDDFDYLSNPFPNMLYDSSSGSFSSTGASDMFEAMALRDSSEPLRSPWPASKEHLGNKTLPCIRPASPHQADAWIWNPNSVQNHLPMFQSCACDSDLPHASSSESIRTSFLADSSSTATSSYPMEIAEQHRPSKGRKTLPDRPVPRLLAAAVLKSNDKPATPQGSKSRRSKSSAEPMSPSVRKTSKLAAKPRHPAALPALTPNPRTRSQSSPGPSPSLYEAGEEVTEAELADRKAKDEFLIASRQKGMTYKQIRQEGGYTEAESTLRGRYRALTKSREERVRKPEWSEIDLILLERGVRELSPPTSNRDTNSEGPQSTKVPWKRVAEYIVQNGGSYHFGNSTCRKKWDELVREQTALGKDPRVPFFEQNTRVMRAAFGDMLRGQGGGCRYGRE